MLAKQLKEQFEKCALKKRCQLKCSCKTLRFAAVELWLMGRMVLSAGSYTETGYHLLSPELFCVDI